MSTTMRAALTVLMASATAACGLAGASGSDNPGRATKRLEIVSAERITTQRSNAAGGHYVYWDESAPDGGLMIILKPTAFDQTVFYSSDFSLAFESEHDIPRRACLGLSMGVAAAESVPDATWMLGGSISRAWVSEEKPYFGVLFEVPRSVSTYELLLARPHGLQLEVTDAGTQKAAEKAD